MSCNVQSQSQLRGIRYAECACMSDHIIFMPALNGIHAVKFCVSGAFDDLSDPFRVPRGRRRSLLKSGSRWDAVAVATEIYKHCMRSSQGRQFRQLRRWLCADCRWQYFSATAKIGTFSPGQSATSTQRRCVDVADYNARCAQSEV